MGITWAAQARVHHRSPSGHKVGTDLADEGREHPVDNVAGHHAAAAYRFYLHMASWIRVQVPSAALLSTQQPDGLDQYLSSVEAYRHLFCRMTIVYYRITQACGSWTSSERGIGKLTSDILSSAERRALAWALPRALRARIRSRPESNFSLVTTTLDGCTPMGTVASCNNCQPADDKDHKPPLTAGLLAMHTLNMDHPLLAEHIGDHARSSLLAPTDNLDIISLADGNGSHLHWV